jgi:hypothetical protein
MQKIPLWLGICVVALTVLGIGSLSWAATVSIPNTQVPTGTATIQVPVQVNQADGIAGFQFALVFDPTVLQATGWSKGGLTSGNFWNPVGNLNLRNQGQVLIGSYGFDPGVPRIASLSPGSGSLITINFNVLGGTGAYTYLSLTTCKLVNNTGVDIASNSLAGRISIGEETPVLLYLPIILR